ncbi:MAG: hypothetical protein ARM1_0443 [Candidatus Micrarchaeota archaeon]|nr:MAG: hypothetical protein ARM1_0443 [Candidatus Micrarchaeota archaeon]
MIVAIDTYSLFNTNLDKESFLIEAIRNVFGVSAEDIDMSDYGKLFIRDFLRETLLKQGIDIESIEAKMNVMLSEIEYTYMNFSGMSKLVKTDKHLAKGLEKFYKVASNKAISIVLLSGEPLHIADVKLNKSSVDIARLVSKRYHANDFNSYKDELEAALKDTNIDMGIAANDQLFNAFNDKAIKAIKTADLSSKELLNLINRL